MQTFINFHQQTSPQVKKPGSPGVHTIDLSSAQPCSDSLNFLTRLAAAKKFGQQLSKELGTHKGFPSLVKHSEKLQNCSNYLAFRCLPSGEVFKVGQAHCKSKICPVCEGVVARKRQNNALSFFQDNQEKLREYKFYHLVLTLRHDQNVRNYNYVDELIDSFSKLRGTGVAARKEWSNYVSGGFYSCENKLGRNGTPHIHAHVFLLAKENLLLNGFQEFVRTKWKAITGDSTVIQLDSVYFLDSERNRVVFDSAVHPVSHLQRAFTESLKYTIKTNMSESMVATCTDSCDQALIGGFSPAFVESLLGTRKRMYNRFGCLYAKKSNSEFINLHKLATCFKDLDNVELTDNPLYSEQAAEMFVPEQTRLAVTPYWNTQVKASGQKVAYEFVDLKKVALYAGQDTKLVAREMSRTLKTGYAVKIDELEITDWFDNLGSW